MARRYINARVVTADVALGEAGTGTEQIAIPFNCADNVCRTWYGYFTSSTTARTLESMKDCGWGGNWDDFTTMTTEVQLVIDDEEWKGEWKEKVQFINKIGGGVAMKKVMDDKSKRDFATRMRGDVAAAFGAVPARPSTPPKAAAPTAKAPPPPGRPQHRESKWPPPPAPDAGGFPGGDDDIPF